MKIVKTIVAILGLSLLTASSLVGAYLPGANQIRILDIIIIFASVIFAILGIWLAVVFPDVMSGIYDRRSAEDKRSLYHKGKRLIFPLVLASFCAFLALVIRICADLLASGGLVAVMGTGIARMMLFFIINILVVGLGVSLAMAVAPGLQALFEGYREVKKAEREERYFVRTQNRD